MEAICTDAVREVVLTKGHVALIDESDWPLIGRSKWCVTCRTKPTHPLYAVATINYQHTLMHRLLMKPEKGFHVDHINGNGLDNRRSNLRICTRSQNLANMTSRVGSSRFKGVHWHKSTNKWKAEIRKNSSVTYLGLHDTEEAAALAYDAKALELFGQFARLNFPILPSHAETAT